MTNRNQKAIKAFFVCLVKKMQKTQEDYNIAAKEGYSNRCPQIDITCC